MEKRGWVWVCVCLFSPLSLFLPIGQYTCIVYTWSSINQTSGAKSHTGKLDILGRGKESKQTMKRRSSLEVSTFVPSHKHNMLHLQWCQPNFSSTDPKLTLTNYHSTFWLFLWQLPFFRSGQRQFERKLRFCTNKPWLVPTFSSLCGFICWINGC